MKSTFKNKKLGDYIHQVDIRNKSLDVQTLLGVSNEKYFMPSIANIVGTDLSSYKIVKYNQFAYGTVTSRNGDKISIALLKQKECIVSSSYIVFEINDINELNPDYLMMWFKRPEFDRYSRYISHGSVRELFGWEKLCEVELPIPSIEEQIKIVEDYKVIEERIAIKEAINNNLFDQLTSKFNLMFGNLFDEIEDKETICVRDLGQIICGKTPSTDVKEYFGGEIPFITIPDMHNNVFVLETERTLTLKGANSQKTKYIPKGSVCVSCIASSGIVSIPIKPSQTNQQINSIIPNDIYGTSFCYFLMVSMSEIIKRKGEGGTATLNLNKNNFEQIRFIKPDLEKIYDFNENSNIVLNQIYIYQQEIKNLNNLRDLIVTKITQQ